MVVLAELVAKTAEFNGYLTYVFLIKDPAQVPLTKYVMCTRFPNWEHREVQLGEVGYLEYLELKAGQTTWYDRNTGQMQYHQYNNNQFIRFIEKPKDEKYEYTM